MKKFLSLVLALVMTMSLVTISAGAKDFTDDDAIKYEEAVAVVSEVGIVDGYADGSFNPDATLTRGAAAKIICNMILGPTTAAALSADTAPYSDVPTDHTFAGYIAYCSQQGIISGYADGTFRPAGTLTGYAFMKMLLGALGYDADVEGYTGANWSIAVAKQALNVGLEDGNDDFVGTKAVTREEACLYAFNALKADMVYYSQKTEVSAGNATVTISGNRYEKENDTKTDGNIDGTEKGDGVMQFAEKYFPNLKAVGGSDDFKRPATTWKLKTEEIGTYVNTSDLVASYDGKVAKGTLYDLLGKTLVNNIDAGKAGLNVYMNGSADKTADAYKDAKYADDTTIFVKNSSSKIGGKGLLTEVYVNDSGAKDVVTIVGIATYVFQAAEDYNSKKETVKIQAAGDTKILLADYTLSADDFDIADVQADDYLLITASVGENGKYTVQTVEPAQVVEGTVNGYTDGDSVTLADVDYSYSFTANKDVKAQTYTVGQDAKVVLDAYGNVIAVDEALVSTNYVYIYDAVKSVALMGGVPKATAFFTDGTVEEITVKKVGSVTDKTAIVDTLNQAENGWYTYSVNSDGKYTLYAVEKKYSVKDAADFDTDDGDSDVTLNGKVNFLVGDTTVKANSSTIFLVLDADDELTVYTGVKSIPDITLKDGDAHVEYIAKSTGYAGFVFIEVNGTSTVVGGDESSDIVYVVKYDAKKITVDNEVYYTFKVLDENGETTKVMSQDRDIFGGEGVKDYYSAFYKIRTDSDGYITSAPAVPNSGKYVAKSGSKLVFTYSDNTLYVQDDSGKWVSFIEGDDAEINLIVTGDAKAALNKDTGADYEASMGISLKTLGAVLEGYEITGSYAGVVTEAGSEELTTLYVTVTNAVVPAPAEEAGE